MPPEVHPAPSSVPLTTQTSKDLTFALMDLLSQIVEKVLQNQVTDKEGKPRTYVSYAQLAIGEGIDPKDYSNMWTPQGNTLQAYTNSGRYSAPDLKLPPVIPAEAGRPPTSPAPPSLDRELEHSLYAAQMTSALFDRRLMVTKDGSFQLYPGSETISAAYQAVLREAQAVPPPPVPDDVQMAVDAAHRLLFEPDKDGGFTGRVSRAYQAYMDGNSRWSKATRAYAQSYAEAMNDPAQGQEWPVTSQALQSDVDNAWDQWRALNADEIEDALDTLDSQGGSMAAFLIAQARKLYAAWDLGLTGAVPVGTMYTEVTPSSFWDATDNDIGFEHIRASSNHWSTGGDSFARDTATSWWNSHSRSTSGGGGFSLCGINLSANASTERQGYDATQHADGEVQLSFGSDLSKVVIELDFGTVEPNRPWLLSQLFLTNQWYLLGNEKGAVGEGDLDSTIAGQEKGSDDPHLMPVIPTQFVFIRNVTIEAEGWGTAGDVMHQYCRDASQDESSSSWAAGGSASYLGIGGSASHHQSGASGQSQMDSSSRGGWWFEKKGEGGTLSIGGVQLAGALLACTSKSPRMDDPNLSKDKKDGVQTGGTPAPQPAVQAGHS